MPGDNRMSLNNILTENGTAPRSQQPKKSRPAIRPPFLQSRMHSSTLTDPWDYARPTSLRSDSSFSTYSAASASSMDSNSLSVPYYRNPGLERSDSSDSCQSGQMSPTTPTEPTDPHQSIAIIPASTRPEDLAAGVALTSLSKQSPYSRPAPLPFVAAPFMPAPPTSSTTTTQHNHPYSPPSPPLPAPAVRRSSSPRAPRDANGNRLYPCPLASAYHCQQHFSTSGHARRHSRIHTGERGAECPECGQRFSRQDNMQQHRRTHRNGRDGRRAAAAVAVAGGPVLKAGSALPSTTPQQKLAHASSLAMS